MKDTTTEAAEAPTDLVTEETPADAIAQEAIPGELTGETEEAPAPFVPDFNSPEVMALREKLAARNAEQAAEAMTLQEALGVIPIKIRGDQFYISEPSVRQEYLLREHLDGLYQRTDKDVDLDLVEAVRGFVCRYSPEAMDLEPLTKEEAPAVLGRRSIRQVIRAIFGEANADPNA